MPDNEKINSVEGQQQGGLDLNEIVQNPSNLDVVNNKDALQKRLAKLFKEEGFSKWPAEKQALAASAAGGLFTAILPLLLVAAPVVAIGAMVGLALFLSVKAVQYGYKGLKWSAEKTVEGAKYTAGKVKEGAVYAKDKVKEAASSVGQATREGTSAALGKMGRSLSNLSESMSGLDSIPYLTGDQSQTVVLKTKEKTTNFDSVKKMLVEEVFEDKAVDNSVLIKKIFSELKGKILEKAYSVDGQQGFKKDQLINQLKQQADFVNKLNAKKLQSLLAQDDSNLYEIFSEHHNEIKRIIGECKREYKFDQSVMRNNAKDAEERKASKSFLSLFSLGRKGSAQSTSSSMDSLNSVSTVSSTAGLLNIEKRKKVAQPSNWFPKFRKGKEDKTSLTYQYFSDEDFYNGLQPKETKSTSTISGLDPKKSATVDPTRLRSNSFNNLGSPELKKVATPEVPSSPSSDSGISSPDLSTQQNKPDNNIGYYSDSSSGRGSGSSTSTKLSLSQGEEFNKELKEKLAKQRAAIEQAGPNATQRG